MRATRTKSSSRLQAPEAPSIASLVGRSLASWPHSRGGEWYGRCGEEELQRPGRGPRFPHGRAEIVKIGGGEVGRLVIEAGWRWSEHIKPIAGTELCEAPHFQYMVSGRVGVQMADGAELELGPGDVNVLPPGHDAWVIGDETAVAIDWGGAHIWAKPMN
jgi:EutQ-like cupin domain